MDSSDDNYQLIELKTLVDHLRHSQSKRIFQDVHRNGPEKVTTFNRIVVGFLSDFCGVNFLRFYQYYYPQSVDAKEEEKQTLRSKKLWPRLVFIYYIYMFFKLCTSVYYQYIYDVHSYQLRNMSLETAEPETGQANNTATYLHYKHQVAAAKMNSARASLEWLGAPFIRLEFVTLEGYQYLLYETFLNYVGSHFWYNWMFPLDFRLGRLLFHPTSEQIYSIELACDEANKFIHSSWHYAQTNHEATKSASVNKCERPHLSPKRHVEEKQLASLVQLRRMAFDDMLRPLNCSHNWHHQLSRYFCLIVCFFLAWLIPLAIVTLVTLPLLVDLNYSAWTWRDWLMLAENSIMTGYFCICSTMWFSIVPLSCIDQTYYINELLILTKRSYKNIQTKWSHLATDKHHQLESSTSLNAGLLHCFIHYKIFISQFRTLRKVFEFTASYVFILWFVLPIVTLIDGPYKTKMTKALAILVCLATCAVLNVILICICHVFNRSLELYEALCSLLAEVVETSHHQVDDDDDELIYDPHLVVSLRKLLENPDLFMRQFASLPMRIHLSYETLMKLYFWSGVILLTILFGVTSRHDNAIMDFLSDPLGLLDEQIW